MAEGGGVAGGLHLETTPDPVTECVEYLEHLDESGACFSSLCDPRLNPEQAAAVVSVWAEPLARRTDAPLLAR